MQTEYAKWLGVSPSYLSDVYAGKRAPGPKILESLGIIQRTEYESTKKRGQK